MGGRVARFVPGWWAVAVLMAGVLLIPAAPAAAHNSLTGSDPANGARLADPPTRIRLSFLARLDPGTTKITITGPDNVPASGGAPTISGSKVTVPFRAGAAGLYVVAYQVASSDGHPIKGEVRFTLTRGTPAAPPSATPTAAPSAVPGGPTAGQPTATPSGAPAPSSTVAVPGSPAADTDSDGGAPWWPWALGAALLLAALAGAIVLTRRRKV
ncbi:copper resistance CopC family protein [Micromonospora echinofusca]|uniref:Copper resistance protein CopC n=1 Tax=Micromonospora echinofusca TaxID=47858 RepID=A0ABS3VZ86_MICEH|nr:copper resistance CopC family protein [Micromonospora echinofusca]MBO4209865.1 copper resistance protein CopC [Micromonospora echinofusca]